MTFGYPALWALRIAQPARPQKSARCSALPGAKQNRPGVLTEIGCSYHSRWLIYIICIIIYSDIVFNAVRNELLDLNPHSDIKQNKKHFTQSKLITHNLDAKNKQKH